jgi:hypothetical protein
MTISISNHALIKIRYNKKTVRTGLVRVAGNIGKKALKRCVIELAKVRKQKAIGLLMHLVTDLTTALSTTRAVLQVNISARRIACAVVASQTHAGFRYARSRLQTVSYSLLVRCSQHRLSVSTMPFY